MESGWLVNSILSKSEDFAGSRPDRSYQSSPIALPSWRASLQGRKSKIPQGFGRAHARASSIATDFTSCSSEITIFNVAQRRTLRITGCESRSGADGRKWTDAGGVAAREIRIG